MLIGYSGQSVCGIGVVKDYYAHQKFNVMEIAKIKNAESKLGEGRVTASSHDP
jgi:tRNA acetyltransferase TAN1